MGITLSASAGPTTSPRLPPRLRRSPLLHADHAEDPSEDPTPDGRGLLATANGGREMVSYLSVLMYGVGGIVVAGNSLLVAFQEKLVYVLILPSLTKAYPFISARLRLPYEDVWLTSSDGVSIRASSSLVAGHLLTKPLLDSFRPAALYLGICQRLLHRPLGSLVRVGLRRRGNLPWRPLAICSFDH